MVIKAGKYLLSFYLFSVHFSELPRAMSNDRINKELEDTRREATSSWGTRKAKKSVTQGSGPSQIRKINNH
jgi:hypothetical protein